MNALRFTNHAKRYGALGFGIAFAIAKSGGLAWARGGLADLAIYVLAGVLGGALFGLATRSRKQLGLLALVGALAFAVGHLVTRYLWAIWGVRVLPEGPAQNPAGAALIFTLAYLAEPTIVGALAGLGIGTIQKNVRQAIRITAITGAGFALGQIIGFGVSLGLWAIIQALASWRLAFNGQLDPWVVGFGNGGWLVAASIVAGVIGGAAAGNILKRSAPERSPMAPG